MKRFVVEYETGGEGTHRLASFDSYVSACDFAAKITSNGTAWPSEARITSETRDTRFHDWEYDTSFKPIDFIDGICH